MPGKTDGGSRRFAIEFHRLRCRLRVFPDRAEFFRARGRATGGSPAARHRATSNERISGSVPQRPSRLPNGAPVAS
jgi:hypothetical protein